MYAYSIYIGLKVLPIQVHWAQSIAIWVHGPFGLGFFKVLQDICIYNQRKLGFRAVGETGDFWASDPLSEDFGCRARAWLCVVVPCPS